MSKSKKPRLSSNDDLDEKIEDGEVETSNANEDVETLENDNIEDNNKKNNAEIMDDGKEDSTESDSGNIIDEDSDNEETRETRFKEKPPVWIDEGDIYTTQEANEIQGRKCNFGSQSSRDYKKVLEEKYKSVMGVHKWAEKRVVENENEFITKSGNLIKKTTALKKDFIEMQKLKDLNCQTYAEGPILKSVLFHPTSTVGLVAGLSGIVSLFQVDGKENTKLQSIQFKKFPITCAEFGRNGEEFLVGSQFHHYFYSHDLISGRSHRIGNLRGTDITNTKKFRITPDGKYIAVLGRFGSIHMLSGTTKELVTTLQMNGDVNAIDFMDSTMYSFGADGEVYVWDWNTRLCVHKFVDSGCIRGTSIAVSPCGKLLACGSSTGVVNIYDVEEAKRSRNPKPLKSVMNLVTYVNKVKFNPSSEILCISSDDKENAIKLVHCPSMTVFSNFPSFQAKFNRPQCMDFSPNSGYFAFGDNKKTAHLFRLKYYGNY